MIVDDTTGEVIHVAAMASNTETDRAKIYIPLLDEAVDVWRPIEARRLPDDACLILDRDYDRSVEEWAFEPGTVVRCPPNVATGARSSSRRPRSAKRIQVGPFLGGARDRSIILDMGIAAGAPRRRFVL